MEIQKSQRGMLRGESFNVPRVISVKELRIRAFDTQLPEDPAENTP